MGANARMSETLGGRWEFASIVDANARNDRVPPNRWAFADAKRRHVTLTERSELQAPEPAARPAVSSARPPATPQAACPLDARRPVRTGGLGSSGRSRGA